MIQYFDGVFDHNVSFRRVALLFILMLVFALDIWTGYEISFALFYLIPISIAAWYDHPKTIMLVTIAAMFAWLTADLITGHRYSSAWIPIWNALARGIFFSIDAILLYKIKRNWIAMKNMAMSDHLTDLNNFRAFHLAYQGILKTNPRKQRRFAIAILDLDGFKAVNDQYGHSIGDEVLIAFANILKNASRNTDVIARLGGDEFALILPEMDESSIKVYDQRLRNLFDLSQLKQNFQVDFSMGVAILVQLPQNVDDATRMADQLMYQSKQLGKSQTTISVVSD